MNKEIFILDMCTNEEIEILEKRFWSKVKVGEFRECWQWIGATFQCGYGKLAYPTGKMQYAHRLSWQLHIGPIPEGKHICHRCDNPICVNPWHLFIGTHADNMRDKAAKGRVVCKYGESSHLAKLSSDAIRHIREHREMRQIDLAAMHGCTQANISYILRNKSRVNG